MTILVIAAHPDDEVLGCGGTMARLSREGHQVHIMILGEGVTSRHQRREAADPAQIAALHARSHEAATILNARELELSGLPDNRFDTVPLLDVVKLIEAQIARWNPELVFTQHGGDLNIDHLVTYRATLTATRPLADCPVRAVYSYEVASSTEWAFYQFAPPFHPNVFWDISGFVEQKVAAMQVYESEARVFPHPRSPEALRAQAVRWGAVCGCEAAEAFCLVREVR